MDIINYPNEIFPWIPLMYTTGGTLDIQLSPVSDFEECMDIEISRQSMISLLSRAAMSDLLMEDMFELQQALVEGAPITIRIK